MYSTQINQTFPNYLGFAALIPWCYSTISCICSNNICYIWFPLYSKSNSICYRCPWRSFVDHWLMRFINSLIHGYTRLSICLHVWFVWLSISMVPVLFSIVQQVVLWSRTCRHYNYGYVIPYYLWTLSMIVANHCGIWDVKLTCPP